LITVTAILGYTISVGKFVDFIQPTTVFAAADAAVLNHLNA